MTEENKQEEVETEVVETEVEIPEETVSEIAEEVAKRISAQADTEKDALRKEIEELKAKAVQTEPTVRKNVFGTTRATDAFESARKEVRLVKQSKALAEGDRNSLKHMNEYNVGLIEKAQADESFREKGVTGRYIRKESYNNSTVNAEGRYLIPDPEFLIAIERYEAQYGIGFANATIGVTDRTQVKANKGADNVGLVELAEGASKTLTKPTYDQVSATMRKFARIVVASDEFIEDQAANYWQDVTEGFARARAFTADQILFTENATEKGILFNDDAQRVTIGANTGTISYDTLLDMQAAVLPQGRLNAKFVMHRSIWNNLLKVKGTANDHYIYDPQTNGYNFRGSQILESEIFPTSSAATGPVFVYGDLSKLQLWVNGGLTLTFSSEGTVDDLSLYEQDLTALRAVTRMTKLVTFPERFVVGAIGTVS